MQHSIGMMKIHLNVEPFLTCIYMYISLCVCAKEKWMHGRYGMWEWHMKMHNSYSTMFWWICKDDFLVKICLMLHVRIIWSMIARTKCVKHMLSSYNMQNMNGLNCAVWWKNSNENPFLGILRFQMQMLQKFLTTPLKYVLKNLIIGRLRRDNLQMTQ